MFIHLIGGILIYENNKHLLKFSKLEKNMYIN